MLKPWLAAEKGNSNHDAAIAPIESLIGRVIHGPSALRRLFLRPNRFSLPAPQTLMANSLFAVAISSPMAFPTFLMPSETADEWLRQLSFACIASCLKQVSPIRLLKQEPPVFFVLAMRDLSRCHGLTTPAVMRFQASAHEHHDPSRRSQIKSFICLVTPQNRSFT